MLHSGFLAQCQRRPAAPALIVGGVTYRYRDLRLAAAQLAAAVRAAVGGRPARVGVSARGGLTSYSGLLACSLLGATFVPLNADAPTERQRRVLAAARLDAMIAEAEPAVDTGDLPVVISSAISNTAEPLPAAEIAGDSPHPAYLLFTSGTTGTPKGVPIGNAAIDHFSRTLGQHYRFRPSDVFAQVTEPTFDVSLIATLGAWGCGGTLNVLDRQRLMLQPGRTLQDSGVTVWTSVPSTANRLGRRHPLRAGELSGLRISIFIGEPLTVATVTRWQDAAPGSRIENLYGPTEVTVAASGYPWPGGVDQREFVNHVVPLGYPLPGVRMLVRDPRTGHPASEGELCLGGIQTFDGYLDDPVRTQEAFVTVDGHDGPVRYYRTGDRVRVLADGCHLFLGRLDDQIKLLGYRVELGEVEAAVRIATGAVEVAATGWPVVDEVAHGVAAFVVGGFELSSVQERLARLLPRYAIPHPLVSVAELPLNSNGKVDRARLCDWLEHTAGPTG